MFDGMVFQDVSFRRYSLSGSLLRYRFSMVPGDILLMTPRTPRKVTINSHFIEIPWYIWFIWYIFDINIDTCALIMWFHALLENHKCTRIIVTSITEYTTEKHERIREKVCNITYYNRLQISKSQQRNYIL